MVSPFMLRNGFQPRYPSDVNRPEYRCENQTYQEKLQEITKRYMEMEKIVSEAHEIAKAKQKVRYDAKQYDVQFKKGDKVLWYCKTDGMDKLHFKWHGPYTVVEKKSPVSYKIQDDLDAEIRDVSVQQIIPFFGDALELDDDDEFIDRRNMLTSLRVGQFVVFQISDDKKWDTLHHGIHSGDPVSSVSYYYHGWSLRHFLLRRRTILWKLPFKFRNNRVMSKYNCHGLGGISARR